jgi:Asp/Glu/hydantoin racemase
MKRLLYQSFGPPDNEAYLGALRRVLGAAGGAHGVAVELGGLSRARLGQKQHPAFHLAAGSDLLDAVLQAERSGVAAAVIGNIQDPALYECRQLCQIPVVGMLEASMAVAISVGRSVALVTTAEATIPLLEDRLRQYGYASRVHSIRPMFRGLGVVSRSFDAVEPRHEAVHEFRTIAETAVREDAEVVLPASGMLATLISVDAGLAAAWDLGLGVPVLNPAWLAVAAGAQMAMAYAHGLTTSRRRMLTRPDSAEIDAYVAGRQSQTTS